MMRGEVEEHDSIKPGDSMQHRRLVSSDTADIRNSPWPAHDYPVMMFNVVACGLS